MKIAKRVIIILLILLPPLMSNAMAETIILKNGKKVVGDIIEESEEVVIISKQNGNFVCSLSRDMIESISESTPEEITKQQMQYNIYLTDRGKEIPRQARLKKYRLERYEKEILSAQKVRGIEKIKFSRNKFGIIDATLNGKIKASLAIDTGASWVIITSDIAKQVGFDETLKHKKTKAFLADGSEIEVIPITLDSVEVGSSRVNNVKAAILDKSPRDDTDGLLGMSFLRHFSVRLDSEENCLVLEK